MAVKSCLRFSTALCLAFTLSTPVAWAQAPSISFTEPQAVKPGGTTDVIIRGGNLAGATGLWTSFPAKVELVADVKDNGKKNDQVVFRVTLPADARVGVHGLRVTTPRGTSPLKLFAIDDMPSVRQEANATVDKAQSLTLPAAVDGLVASLGRNYYKFQAAAGQRLSFEVLARRMGSPLDPLIRVLDATGRELDYSDDAPGLSADSQLSYTFSAAGEYFVEIRDIRYQGGGNFRYRLRVGDFPCVSAVYPMGAKRGSDVTLSFAGSQIDDLEPLTLKVPTEPSLDWLTVGAKRAGGQVSGFAVLSIGDGEEFLEAEPNNVADKANRVNFATNLNGRLEKPGDVDRFVFAAKKGQKTVFSPVSRTQGSPSAVHLRLFDTKGKKVSEADNVGVSAGVINYTFPEDGDYTLAVNDYHGHGGSQFVYRINVSAPQTGFQLTASSDTLNIPAGGVATITVNSKRSGYNGLITVAAANLPEGVSSSPTVIGPAQNTVVLTVKSAAAAKTGSVFPIQIVGTAKIGEADFQAVATVSAALKASFSQMPYPPQVLDKATALAIAPKPNFVLRTEPAQIVFGRDLQATVKIIVERQKGYDEEIALAVLPVKTGLPAGITAAVKPIPKGKNEIEIVFSATNKAPLGDFTGVLTGSLKKDKTTSTQPSPGLQLKLSAPLVVSVDFAAGKLTKGGQLKVKATVNRNPALSAPVAVTFQNLPKGVTAAAASIPPGKTEVEILLTAAQDAQVGKVGNVTIKGDATLNKKNFSATSSAVALIVE